jgi:hypothetical protein
LKKYSILLVFICLFSTGSLPAQSTAVEIETLLSTDAVTYAAAARFLLEASETMKTSNPEEAFNYAVEQNWLPKTAAANDPARLDAISLLLMRSFNIKGGLLFSITKNSHYAYRELVYKKIIQGRTDPSIKLSGERLLLITGRILSRGESENEHENTSP